MAYEKYTINYVFYKTIDVVYFTLGISKALF